MSVETTGDNPSTVRNELSERADQLYGGLLAGRIDTDSISTDRFSVRERVDRRRREQTDDGPRSDETYYEGTHSFRIEVTAVDSVGDVVETAADSGADTVANRIHAVG